MRIHGDQYINFGTTDVIVLANDTNDGRLQVLEDGLTAVDLDANSQFVFNEQGLDRNFRVESDNDANMLFVDAGLDRVGIGTGTPAYDLQVVNTNAIIGVNTMEIADLGAFNLGLDGDIVPYAGSSTLFDLGNNNATEHWDEVVANTFTVFSDRRTKNNIQQLKYGLDEILQLNPVSFRYNKDIADPLKTRLGLIAQEVETIIPEIVISEDVDINPDTGARMLTPSEYKSMSYQELIPVLIKGMQEQQKQIEVLKNEIENLKKLSNNRFQNSYFNHTLLHHLVGTLNVVLQSYGKANQPIGKPHGLLFFLGNFRRSGSARCTKQGFVKTKAYGQVT